MGDKRENHKMNKTIGYLCQSKNFNNEKDVISRKDPLYYNN